jgi:hypothetical protein
MTEGSSWTCQTLHLGSVTALVSAHAVERPADIRKTPVEGSCRVQLFPFSYFDEGITAWRMMHASVILPAMNAGILNRCRAKLIQMARQSDRISYGVLAQYLGVAN